MAQHETAPAGFAFFMRLFIIGLATMISIGTRGLAESEGEHQAKQANTQQEVV